MIYDRAWLARAAAAAGLTISHVDPPSIRGFHWDIRMTPTRPGVTPVELPEDLAERGRNAPPAMPAQPYRIGLA